MNKILVSGLAIGSADDINTCQSCNYDISWLIKNPSTLLWTDKIILTPEIINYIKNEGFNFHNKNKNLSKAIKILFEQLEFYGLIEIKKVSSIIDTKVKSQIHNLIKEDLKKLVLSNSSDISFGKDINVPGQLYISDIEYCYPSLWTKYASLILAKEWNANLFMSKDSHLYFEKLFQLKQEFKIDNSNLKLNSFEEIFKMKLPEYELLPMILFDAKLCNDCKNFKECDSDVFLKLEKNIEKFMEWKDYDEIHQLREVLNKITNQTKDLDINNKEFIGLYKDEEKKIRIKLNSVFPKIERWSNIVTAISVPVILLGTQYESSSLKIIGGAAAGIGTVTNKYLDILKNKYKWVTHRIE